MSASLTHLHSRCCMQQQPLRLQTHMNTVYEGCFTRGCVASFSAPQVPLYTKARHFVLARHLVVTAATSAHSRQGEPRGWPQSRSLPVTSLHGR